MLSTDQQYNKCCVLWRVFTSTGRTPTWNTEPFTLINPLMISGNIWYTEYYNLYKAVVDICTPSSLAF